MSAEELFEEKRYLVFSAIKQQFGNMRTARIIAEKNNMELDDLIQVGQMMLWKLCLTYNPEKDVTFNGYVVKSIKLDILTELHTKGTTIKVSTSVSREERDEMSFHSVDLYRDGEIVNGFFAVSPVDVEKEVIRTIEVETALSVLDETEKFIFNQKILGFTDREVAKKLDKSKSYLNTMKTNAFLKINPEYKPRQKKNHLRQQVV